MTAYHSRSQGYVSLLKKSRNTTRLHWNCNKFTKWHVNNIVKYVTMKTEIQFYIYYKEPQRYQQNEFLLPLKEPKG